MTAETALNIQNAWNSVALEERLELIAKSQSQGIAAALASMLILGSIAYGLDQIWLLALGLAISLAIIPLFANQSWRKGKPELILSYLAVRSVARRYAYGYNINNLDIILILRGEMKEIFSNRTQEELHKRNKVVDFEESAVEDAKVWIVLLRGAIVILSERRGGAKLEFIAPITPEIVCEKPAKGESEKENAILVGGSGPSKNRRIVLSSNYQGALYVLEKQLEGLKQEATELYEKIKLVNS